MKKYTYYFSHDFNAHNDTKILFLRQQLGMEGYGIYWYLIEILAEAGGSLPLKIVPVLASQMQSQEVKVRAVISEFDLFIVSDDTFFSMRLSGHLEKVNNLKSINSEKGKKSAALKKSTAVQLQLDSGSTAVQQRFNSGSTEPQQKKRKEKKGKEINSLIISNNHTVLEQPKNLERDHTQNSVLLESNLFRQPKIPQFEQVHEQFLRIGATEEMARIFFDKHESTGWFLNNSPIINWAALANTFVANWEKNERKFPKNDKKPPKTDYRVQTPRDDW
jgi:hypothetical protein